MALEDLNGSGKFITSLVPANPLSSDDRREGDDHIRGIKNVLRNTFPGLNGPVDLIGGGDGFLPLAGGTLMGPLGINHAESAKVILDGPAGSYRIYQMNTSTKVRWFMGANSSAESGASAGSNFVITRFDDSGALLGDAIGINRATGAVSIAGVVGIGPSMQISEDGVLAKVIFSGSNTVQFYKPDGRIQMVVNGAAVQEWFVDKHIAVAGAALKPGGGPWTDTSDVRIKQDIADYTSGLDAVMALRPRTYRFKPETGRDTSITHMGLIAQECEQVMPEMVSHGAGEVGEIKCADLRTLDSGPLLYALVNAVKELAGRVQELEAALEREKSRIIPLPGGW